MPATDTSADFPAPSAGVTRPRLALVALALPSLLIAMDISLLTIALPRMAADLDASATELLWITDIYGLLVAGSMITMGAVGDRIGRRKLIMICAAVFAVASAGGAFATTALMVILARAVMGIAGSGIMPASMALIGVIYPDESRRTSAMGVYMTCFLVGMATAPFVGGLLLSQWWWGSAFLLGVPVMLVTLLLAPRLLPEFRSPTPGRLDLTSAALSIASVLLLVFALKKCVAAGPSVLVAVTVVAGLAAGWQFVRRQLGAAEPVVDVTLFRQPHLVRVMLALLLTALLMGGTSIYVALYLQNVRGLSPLESAVWLLPQMVAMIAASNVGPWLARHLARRTVVLGSLGVMTLGFVCYTMLPEGPAGLPVLALGTSLATAGIGAALPLLMDDVITSAPPERAGSAASLAQTCNELGIAVGLVILGSLGTVVYRALLDSPADAHGAEDGIVRAVSLAVPRDDDALLAAARTAFTGAFHVVGLTGVAVMVVVLLLTSRRR